MRVGVAVQIDVVPGEGAEFFGAGAGQQRDDDIGVQPAAFGGGEDGVGLSEGECLGRAAWLRQPGRNRVRPRCGGRGRVPWRG